MLYLVATPIGNLEDITYRAIRILQAVTLIAAEDTRHTRKLLSHYDIHTPLTSYHEYSTPQRLAELIETCRTGDVALVSDAGMPGLSDPGYRLVSAAVDAGIGVSPIPGPTAVVAALVASGLPTDRFLFLGFLPRQSKARRTALREISHLPATIVLYEAPHRLVQTLTDAAAVLGDRPVVIARELTKFYEELWRGTLPEAKAHFRQGEVRGEITVVIGGAVDQQQTWDEATVRRALQDLLRQGHSRKAAAADLSRQSGWRKNDLYRLSLEIDDQSER